MPETVPVILSGGAGTRLWPASRAMYPKQLPPLTGGQGMLLVVPADDVIADLTVLSASSPARYLRSGCWGCCLQGRGRPL